MNTDNISFYFSSIIGHRAQLAQLSSMLQRGTLPHALLLSGPAGIGKRTLAHALATAVFADGFDGTATTRSENTNTALPDLQLLSLEEGKKEISIEVIRELCAKLHMKPFHGKANVAIIDEAHLMSMPASNALLMTLEEPNAHSLLILVSSAAHRLPATIRSRCQTVHFGEFSEEELAVRLAGLLDLPADDDLIRRALSFCNGTLDRLPIAVDENGELPEPKKLRSTLAEFIAEEEEVRLAIKRVTGGRSKNAITQATMLAADYGASRDNQKELWEALFIEVRKELRGASIEKSSAWADLLLESITAEQQVRERYANTQLHWTSTLTKIAAQTAVRER